MTRTDAVLVAALFVVGALEAALSVRPAQLAPFIVIPALTVPLSCRRRMPVAVALVVTAALVVPVIVGSAVLLERTFTGFICVLIACYTLGRRGEGHAFALATVACTSAFALTIGLNDGSVASGVLAAMIVVAAMAGGRVVRDRARLVELLEQQERELEAASRLQVDAAAGRERDRLSSELADLVSQGVSEMVLQVRVARQVASSDPRSAVASIEAVETAGKEALGEMRRLLGTLRRADEELALAPQPSLVRLDLLVERARRAGRTVDVSVEGEPVALPPGVDAAAYRIIEDALAAGERRGANRMAVCVRHARHVLEVELSSDVPLLRDAPAGGAAEATADGADDGAAMVGIRERVAAFDGELRAGPTGNGYVLWARLPLSGRPVRSAPPVDLGESTGGPADRRRSSSGRTHAPALPVRSQVGNLAVLALCALAVVEAAATVARQGSPLANAVVAAAIAAPLLFWRSRPVVGSAVAWAAAVAMAAFLTPVSEVPTLFMVLLLYPYTCARYAGRRRARAGLAVSLAGVLLVDVLQGTVAWGDLLFPVLLLSLSWGVGRMTRSRAVMAREVAERAQQLEQARDEQVAAAAAAERRRIARELHDVVAHTLSVMVVQSGAARWTFERDAARAGDALAIVEETGRTALVELRRLLGFLSSVEAAEMLRSQPGLGTLGELVERMAAAGMPVEVQIEGEPGHLPPALQLAIYRIIQEALTNALRHADGARAQVTVRYADEEVYLEVVDDGRARQTSKRGDQHGHGLAGMRERAALHGGEVSAGRRAGGGFAVRARLPVPVRWAPPEQPALAEGSAVMPVVRWKDEE